MNRTASGACCRVAVASSTHTLQPDGPGWASSACGTVSSAAGCHITTHSRATVGSIQFPPPPNERRASWCERSACWQRSAAPTYHHLILLIYEPGERHVLGHDQGVGVHRPQPVISRQQRQGCRDLAPRGGAPGVCRRQDVYAVPVAGGIGPLVCLRQLLVARPAGADYQDSCTK